MNYIVTGCAGFIGFHVVNKLLSKNNRVIGIDNLNNYYDVKLKRDRLSILKKKSKNFSFKKIDICNFKKLERVFKKIRNFKIIHLAAQAGVRYSLKNPKVYISSNLIGFWNILELSKKYGSKHLIFASSSSVYGLNKKYPYFEKDVTDSPKQLYAATKKSNEVISHSYASLFNMKITGLRFFTVYGPFGRPDMAIFKFTKNILKNSKIEVYNNGNHFRDFTYIDDIANAIILSTRLIDKRNNYEIYNIGNGKAVHLKKCVKFLGEILNKQINIIYKPAQKGDMYKTYANTNKFKSHYKFKAKVNLKDGLKKFVSWYKNYYYEKK